MLFRLMIWITFVKTMAIGSCSFFMVKIHLKMKKRRITFNNLDLNKYHPGYDLEL